MNPLLQSLQPYPFEKVRQLLVGTTYRGQQEHISLSIGEPKHTPPDFVLEAISSNLDSLSQYPATRGIDALRESIARWLQNRFQLSAIDCAEQVLPVNGTREALFAFAQAVVNPLPGALVMCPNPFYQIYEGAALLAGATPRFINCRSDTAQLPDFDAVTEDEWARCQLLYLCSPGNPTGAVLPLAQLTRLIELAREFDFIIASDECYSEIYFDEAAAPPGLLQACAALGETDYRNCVVFHSLSKRSNLPGLRSGFVAGDARILRDFLRYRTYHGCAMPVHHQLASIAAWNDEEHVRHNRRLYRQKFKQVLQVLDDVLPLQVPDAGFYLWPQTPCADTDFARRLFVEEHVSVLPGSFLARSADGINPGENRIRLALVAAPEQCLDAAHRIRRCVQRMQG